MISCDGKELAKDKTKMVISECLSIKVSQVLQSDDVSYLENDRDNSHSTITPQHEWNAGIASIQKLLSSTINLESEQNQGIIISSHTPIIDNIHLVSQIETVVFSCPKKSQMALMPCQEKIHHTHQHSIVSSSFIDIPFNTHDVLQQEQFCLILTDKFACVLAKTDEHFYFSFTPEIIKKVWYLLKARLVMTQNSHHDYLQQLVDRFYAYIPSYQIICQFTRYLMMGLKQQELVAPNQHNKINSTTKKKSNISLEKSPLPTNTSNPELELLQALTHEIRTPLATIKTITKLLKRKAKAKQDISKDLEVIEQECTEQINRMELIFQVVELESKPTEKKSINLVNTCLENILNQSVNQWKNQAQRRNIILDIVIEKNLPNIVSEPKILTQALNGLMERFIRSLPSGDNFKVMILPVGNQLKLQFLSESGYHKNSSKCLGKMLLFQPETGRLSLSNDVTRNLFHTLGGKLTIKDKPGKGEVLTIFLPLKNK